MARGKIEKRGQRRRKIKPVILIVTEGSQTEPKYFEHYRNRQTNIDIHVVGSRTSGGETDYLSLIRKAVEYQNKNQISVSEGDTKNSIRFFASKNTNTEITPQNSAETTNACLVPFRILFSFPAP